MHGPTIATLTVAAILGLARPSNAGTSEAVAEARRRLDRNEATAAVAILEDALPDATPGASRDAVLDLLRRSYEKAARQAENAGKAREAETYRVNLRILARKPRTATAPTPESAQSPAPEPTPVEPPTAPPALPDLAEPPAAIVPAPEAEPARPFAADRAPEPAEPPTPAANPAPLRPLPIPAPAPAPGLDIESADAAFLAKDYAEAGRIYGALARDRQLPAERREHWAYCRSAEVVRKINAPPRTEAEWAAIRVEIAQIRTLLSPDNWLDDYLADLVASKSKAARKKPAQVVVRGSAPEEPVPADRPVRTVSNQPAAEPAPAVASAGSPRTEARTGPPVGRWQIRDTANFRIYHTDPSLAEKVAQVAEAVRRDQTRRWTNALPKAPWQPQCEIYLYPTAQQYATMTGQPEDSPGFSTMGMNGGRIVSRRVNLRADHPTLVPAVLPHEITHVILADLFAMQQIPRWADEGMAVLSEPADEQNRRAGDLVNPLAANRVFPVDTLMNMDYPDNRYWALYYAQSVSLTRFLVEQGTPAQMVQFLQAAQREGYEAGLRKVYKIDGFPDLQRRWLAFARTSAPTRTATAPPVAPDLKVR